MYSGLQSIVFYEVQQRAIHKRLYSTKAKNDSADVEGTTERNTELYWPLDYRKNKGIWKCRIGTTEKMQDFKDLERTTTDYRERITPTLFRPTRDLKGLQSTDITQDFSDHILVTTPELGTLEWWISRSMLDPLFFIISRLTKSCTCILKSV